MDLLDRLADQVHPACGQVLGPEQEEGDGVGGDVEGLMDIIVVSPQRQLGGLPVLEAASLPLVGC